MYTIKVEQGSITFDERGKLPTITGVEKIQQDIMMRLTGNSQFYQLLGRATQLNLQTEQNLIIRAFTETVQQLQQYQATRSNVLDPGERILEVRNVGVRVLDRTSVVVAAVIVTDAGEVGLPFHFNCDPKLVP